jgi:hypothetical protein
MLNEGATGTRGFRRVIVGPDQPYFAGIDEADSLPRNASFDEGVHNMEILAAVAESAAKDGAAVKVTPQRVEVGR